MQQHNDDFYKLFDDLPMDVPEPSKKEKDALHARVMNQIGNQKNRRVKTAGKIALLAAAFATCMLAVAATYYGVNDLFRTVLVEQGPSGDAVPIASMQPVVEKAGQLVEETVVSEGVSVSLRGIVGDASGFKAILDISDPSGKPIALKQADGTYAQDNYRFYQTQLDPADDEASGGYGFGYSSMETVLSYTGDKLSLLLDISTQGLEGMPGGKYALTLTDLMQLGTLSGEEIGLAPGDLYHFATAFPPVSDADFRVNGASDEDGDGILEKESYELVTDTDQQLPLSPDLPEYFVTNAAFQDGMLYLRGIGPSEAAIEEFFRAGFALRNKETGDVLDTNGNGTGYSETSWTLQFDNIPPLAALKDYVIVAGYGENVFPVLEGTWAFELDFTNEAVSVTKELAIPFEMNGVSFTADSLTLSPFYMHLNLSVAADETGSMTAEDRYHHSDWDTTWHAKDRFATVTLKDGTALTVPVGGSMQSDTAFDLQFSFDVVIDPTQVASIAIEGLVIPLV